MTLTRQTFELVARAVRESREDHSEHLALEVFAQVVLDMLADRLATEFASTNPRFDRERFLDACGYEAHR